MYRRSKDKFIYSLAASSEQCGFIEQKKNRAGENNLVCKMVNKEDSPELETWSASQFAVCGWIVGW